MKIKKIRIRSPKNYLVGIGKKNKFFIGLQISDDNHKRIVNSGFSKKLEIGETILPKPIGKISDLNANGSFIKLTDLPKETVHREIEMTDWHGYTHWVDVPYKRYQRKPIPAPSIELTITNVGDKKILSSPELENTSQSYEKIKQVINLFLELYDECEILKEDLTPSFKNIKRLNWNVLPPGQFPWEKLKDKVKKIVSKYGYSPAKKKEIEKRTRLINSFSPDFVAVGNAGFHGYIIFGFEKKNFYILESVHLGNATYVFGNDWEELSKLSKKEILDGGLQQERIIHRQNWEAQIRKLFN